MNVTTSNDVFADLGFPEYGAGFGPEASFVEHGEGEEVFLEGSLPWGMHVTNVTKVRRESGFGSETLYDGDAAYEEYVQSQWGALWSMAPYHQARRILEGVERADGTRVPGLIARIEGLAPAAKLDVIVDVMSNLASLKAIDLVEQDRFRAVIRDAVSELHAVDAHLGADYVARICALLPAPQHVRVAGTPSLVDPTAKLRRALERIVNPEAVVAVSQPAPARRRKAKRSKPSGTKLTKSVPQAQPARQSSSVLCYSVGADGVGRSFRTNRAKPNAKPSGPRRGSGRKRVSR